MKTNKIYCLQDDIGFVELISSNKDVGLSVVNSARCSYGGSSEEFNDKDKKLVSYLWKHGHTSPFRHSYYTFHIRCPLMAMRQWMKYQVGATWRTYYANGMEVCLEAFDNFFDEDKGCSWNELSGRYSVLEPEFYIPHKLRANTGHGSRQSSGDLDWEQTRHDGYRLMMKDRMNDAYTLYKGMLADGVAREIARSVLPQSIYSEAYWTVSLQSLIHFLKQRLQPDAQFEIRQCALGIYQLVKSDFDKLGISFEDIVS